MILIDINNLKEKKYIFRELIKKYKEYSMNKKFLSVMMASVMAFSIAACSSGDEDTAPVVLSGGQTAESAEDGNGAQNSGETDAAAAD